MANFELEKDLTSAERPSLQKLFLWKDLASGGKEFRQKSGKPWTRAGANPAPSGKWHV
jgi:hypothetical protein